MSPSDLGDTVLKTLGLDSEAVDLMSVEALCASVRRAASFLCPIAPRFLIDSVNDVLTCVPGYSDETSAQVEAVLEALVRNGDLLELSLEDESGRTRLLYLGPPAFVRRQSGAVLLFGIRPEGAPLVSGELMLAIEREMHARMLRTGDETTLQELADDGLVELQVEQWLHSPSPLPASELIQDYEARVQATADAGPLDGVRVLDPARPISYYRGRWRDLRPADSGMFVARRSQGYGADLWCFLEVTQGEVRRGIDLPVHDRLGTGADEAWWLQAAIDAHRGRPQRMKVHEANRDGWTVIDLFSPIPSWAQRRLDLIAQPLLRSRGALLSYAVPTSEVIEEVEFLRTMLWLAPVADEGILSG